jgi:nucleoside-diphosphate-sugar epimerase
LTDFYRAIYAPSLVRLELKGSIWAANGSQAEWWRRPAEEFSSISFSKAFGTVLQSSALLQKPTCVELEGASNQSRHHLLIMSTRYLITGGAGFLGINLCRYLLSQGHFVRSIDIAPFDYPERGSIDVVDGDIRDRATVDRAVADVDIVVHGAAALPLAPRSDILSTAVVGTRNLLESAVRQAIQRFIFISSTAVYGIPDHHPLLESDGLHGVGPYGESKVQAESLCAGARTQGLCTSILRPKSFVGPERLGAFELLYDWAYSGRSFPVLGPGDNRESQ